MYSDYVTKRRGPLHDLIRETLKTVEKEIARQDQEDDEVFRDFESEFVEIDVEEKDDEMEKLHEYVKKRVKELTARVDDEDLADLGLDRKDFRSYRVDHVDDELLEKLGKQQNYRAAPSQIEIVDSKTIALYEQLRSERPDALASKKYKEYNDRLAPLPEIFRNHLEIGVFDQFMSVERDLGVPADFDLVKEGAGPLSDKSRFEQK